jgi:hypothetical protein
MSMEPTQPSSKEAIDTILGLNRLPMAQDEYESLLRMYPYLREKTLALRIPETRYAEPAIIYPASP